MQGNIEKKKSRLLWKIGLLGLSSKKYGFRMQNSLSSTLEACIERKKIVPNLIQIIINIVMLVCKPNIDLELCKTFLQEVLQSKMENDGARTFIETCGN
jgi:hypothetical protein